MDIYLVRHAIAVPRSEDALDHARPLTPKGRDRFIQSVSALEARGVILDRVYHSPWVRARQTAELLAPINPSGTLVATDGLARPPTPALLGELEGRAVALVGHEPYMGELLALLLLDEAERGFVFHFKKGAVAHLAGRAIPGGAELHALWDPKTLRAARRP